MRARKADGTARRRWLPGAAVAAAILTCYGTFADVGLLSLFGISVAVHEGLWAGLVIAFAAIAATAVALGYRVHGSIGPPALAAVGLGLLAWVMFARYDPLLEIFAFVALVVVALWDWRAG